MRNLFANLYLFALCWTGFSTIGCLEEKSVRAKYPYIAAYGAPAALMTPSSTPTPAPITRSSEVQILNNFCGCWDSHSDILGDCETFCQEQNAPAPTLFLNTILGPQALQQFNNLGQWCESKLTDQLSDPHCFLHVENAQGEAGDLPIKYSSKNSFNVNISALRYGQVYLAQLVVIDSQGVVAQSTSIQFQRRRYIDLTGPAQGLLKISPIAQYRCLANWINILGQQVYYQNVSDQYFFYPPSVNPSPLPLSVTWPTATSFNPHYQYYLCHQLHVPAQGQYGSDLSVYRDHSLLPRMNLVPNAFWLWDANDLRFFKTINGKDLDINLLIKKQLEQEFGSSSSINLFQELTWATGPAISAEQLGNYRSSYRPTNLIGIIMQPWLNPQTQLSYCPSFQDLQQKLPLMQVLRSYTGPTEGLYLARRESTSWIGANGQYLTSLPDLVLIRESWLKEIWFYQVNGQVVSASELTARKFPIYFYWPANPQSPLIQNSAQQRYQLITPDELSSIEAPALERTSYPSSDKRLGCIPSTGNIY